jgi:hypothetical protein
MRGGWDGIKVGGRIGKRELRVVGAIGVTVVDRWKVV